MNIKDLREFGVNEGYPILKDESIIRLIAEIKKVNPKNTLEIGTAIGYSGTQMLLNSDAFLDTIEYNEHSANIARQNFETMGLTSRVNIFVGDAGVVLDELVGKNKQYDFIFLDGPKGQYVKYLERLIGLLREDGVLIADNVLFRGYVRGDIVPKRFKTLVKRLREFLDRVTSDTRLQTEVLDIGDGLSISKKITRED